MTSGLNVPVLNPPHGSWRFALFAMRFPGSNKLPRTTRLRQSCFQQLPLLMLVKLFLLTEERRLRPLDCVAADLSSRCPPRLWYTEKQPASVRISIRSCNCSSTAVKCIFDLLLTDCCKQRPAFAPRFKEFNSANPNTLEHSSFLFWGAWPIERKFSWRFGVSGVAR